MTLETKPFDASKYLTTPEAIAEHVSEALATADPAYIAHALGTAAKARGMTEMSRTSGVPRPTLYKALQASGKPELGIVLKVVAALGVRLVAEPAEPSAAQTPAA